MLIYKNLYVFASLVLLTIIVTTYLTPNAFAASPIVSAIADDPDDINALDDVYTTGDTITITFPAATNGSGVMRNEGFRANFTVNTSSIDTSDILTGVWNTASTAITFTIRTINGNDPPIINTDTISYDVSNGNLFYAVNDTAGGAGTEFTGTAVTLTGDFGLYVAGGSCEGDCDEPTLGVSSYGNRLVSGGFTYNDQSIDVERYFTPYPLVTVQTGKENIAKFKIFDDGGPDNIRHFELAFGLSHGESIGTSKVVINWDKSFDDVETVTLVDPENILENVNITTSEGSCFDDVSQECLVVQVVHTFRESLDFNIIGTNVWDAKRNAWQNYYNHGIEIVGESLNPPKKYDGTDKGHIYHLTETGKNTAVDEFGDTWVFSKTWIKNYIKNEKAQDLDIKVMERNHSTFANLISHEIIRAEAKLLVLCPTCLESFDDFVPSTTITYHERINSLDDPEIQKKMAFESDRAQKIMDDLFYDPHTHSLKLD